MAQAMWGVEVRSMATGAVLYERNSRKLMMPASNMKIVTLATAARTLGWDYRFTTTLETAAPVEAGTLAGDLIVRGGGDPTINHRDDRAVAMLDRWAQALKAAGIERIDGRIIGDDNAFDDATLGGGWAWDYLQYGYAAPVGALEFNESVAALTVRPGAHEGEPPFVELALRRRTAAPEPRDHRRVEVTDDDRFRAPGRQSDADVTGAMAVDSPTGRARRRGRQPNRLLRPIVEGGADRTRDRGDRRRYRRRRHPRRTSPFRPPHSRLLWQSPPLTRNRDGDDESQSEPLRGDTAQGHRRVQGRTGHY